MSRFAYVSGRYLRKGEALVSIEDRGYQFADGVYEVIAVHRGHLVDRSRHLQRLDRAVAAFRVPPAVGGRGLVVILDRMLALNRIANGIVYIQVTRGVARRDHTFAAGLC